MNRLERSRVGRGAVLLAGLLLPAAGSRPQRPPDVAPYPVPLTAPEPETGSPSIAAAPPPLESPPPPQPPANKPVPVRTDRLRLTGLMDRDVVGPDKLDIGHVIDVLVDPDGEPRAVLVETGGFLGIGNRKIAVAWTGISFPENKLDGPIRTDMTMAQVRSAPAYGQGGPVTVAVGVALPAPKLPPAPAAPPSPLPSVGTAAHDAPIPVAEPPAPLPNQRSVPRTSAPRNLARTR